MDNLLFGSEIKKVNYREKFRPYVRCDCCIYSEVQEGLPPNYLHCLKYPNMISMVDQTCKAGVKKEGVK